MTRQTPALSTSPAGYGEPLMERLSQGLTLRFGRGFSARNLEQIRLFYATWQIPQTELAQSLNQKMSQFGMKDLSVSAMARFRQLAQRSCRLEVETLAENDAGLLEKLRLIEGAYYKLRIWNPAALPEGWTMDKLLAAHPSSPYNSAIANAFFRAGEIEAWGRGVERIFSACEAAGVPQPVLRYEPNDMWMEFAFSEAYLKAVGLTSGSTSEFTPQVEAQVDLSATEQTLLAACETGMKTAKNTA